MPSVSNIQKILHRAEFFISVPTVHKLTEDFGKEVAFVGRSNSGKSSTLNQLTQSKIARTSKTPGRTQAINIFKLTDELRLVDLPGYGYAKTSKSTKNTWPVMMSDYLSLRDSLVGLVIIMDIRHPFKDIDHWILDWCYKSQMPCHIVLNKADKMSYGQAKQIFLKLQKDLNKYQTSATIFSAQKGTGLEELFNVIEHWLTPNREQQDDKDG